MLARRVHTLLWVLILLVIIAVFHVALSSISMLYQKDDKALVGVYFYPWFSSNGRHWNSTIDPTWAIIEEPIIGFYDSRDEHVIRWQLRLIRDAGIDFIVLSWWGPGSFEDEAIKTIVKYIREYSLKFAILVEPYLGNDASVYNREFWEKVLNYIRANFIEPYRDSYMHLHGKPLVLAFNPIGLSYRPHEDFPDYTIRVTGNDIDNARYQDWDYWPDYLHNSLSIELRIRRDNMVSITPRFCDTHFRAPGTCLDPDLSQGFYRRQWEWVLKNADRINIVVITSWNEYHERTQVEPSHSTETREPWLLYNITKAYVSQFKSSKKISTLSLNPLAVLLAIGGALVAFSYATRSRSKSTYNKLIHSCGG